ncbi:MAG: hypothetical protein LIP28_04195 [Deltaproteobacteria bacterium]|nr:hypothetical protein [Deltaproteobacteria bacterium]
MAEKPAGKKRLCLRSGGGPDRNCNFSRHDNSFRFRTLQPFYHFPKPLAVRLHLFSLSRKGEGMAVWIDGLIQRETAPLLESAMSFSFQRHLNIMNNIANVETPFYKRKTLPEENFRKAMHDALQERYNHHWNEFSPRDQSGLRFYGNHLPLAENVEGREWGPERNYENNVIIEKEMADLAKNAAYMEALQQIYKNKTTSLRSALRDRVA